MSVDFYISLIQQCFPQTEIRIGQLLSDGSDHLMVEINEEILFRFARYDDREDKVVRESKLLPFLEECLSVPVPHIEYVWLPQQTYVHPFIGYRKLQGTWLDDKEIYPVQRDRCLPQLAVFLRELHTVPVDEAIRHGMRGGSFAWWTALYQKRYAQIQAIVFPFLSREVQKKAQQKWESFLSLQASMVFQPVPIHMDLWLHHILCDPHQGELRGVIDWGDATIGDPVLDYMGFDSDWGRDVTVRIASMAREDYNASFWQRLDLYAEFYLRFYPPYTRALKAFQSNEQQILLNCVQRIQQSFDA